MPTDLKQLCAIVVPIYKKELNHNESLVLKNMLKLFSNSMIYFVCPKSLNLPTEIEKFNSERFDDDFFKGLEGYNKLLKSKTFYQRFNNFKYILIHQLDAYLFKNELKYWCNQNYDYIGAPWLRDESFFYKLFRSKRVKNREIIFNKVGNGGLSLRKIKTFESFLNAYEDIVNEYKHDKLYSIEDVFWSIIAPKHQNMSIPDYKTAARFSLDRKPEIGMQLNNAVLPFGCHGFEKSKTKPFWKKHIKGLQ